MTSNLHLLLARTARRLFERVRCDASTARARVGLLWRHEIFLALEVVTCAVAALWGLRLLPEGTSVFRDMPLYKAFYGAERVWGAFYLVMGLAGLYATLTRGREMRLMTSTFVLLSFLNLVVLQMKSGLASPAPLVYALVGVVLPGLCVAWHLVNLWADEVQVVHVARTDEARAGDPPTATA